MNAEEMFFNDVAKEQRKIVKELKKVNISEQKLKVLEPLIENVAWMRVKLDEIRCELALETITTTYDNGGGQKGIRRNPKFDGYETLWKSYMLGMNKILDIVPNGTGMEDMLKIELSNPKTMLDKLRQK